MEIATCVVVLFFIDVSMVSSQIITQTPCEYFGTKPMEPFNKNLYQGEWFIHQLIDIPESMDCNCYLQIRTPNSDGNHNITEILINSVERQKSESHSVATFNPDGKGHYIFAYLNYPEFTIPYQILATDYVNYAIEWSCVDAENGYICYLFILTRTPVVIASIQSEIDETLQRHHIRTSKLRTLKIASCPSEMLKVDSEPVLIETVLQIVAGLLGVVGGLVGYLVGRLEGCLVGVLVGGLLGGLLRAILG